MHTKRYKNKQSGFTLIELMIVVAIMAILAAIATPSYLSHIAKSRRADVQGALLSFANAMERHYTTNGTYEGAAAGGADTGTPTIFSTTSPTDGSTVYYNLTISAADASSYTLQATAVGAQAGDGNLQYTSTGVKRWDRDNNGFGAGDNNWNEH